MMARGVHLSAAKPSDAGTLADVDATLSSHPWTERQFLEEIVASGSGRVLVLRRNDGEGIAGFVVLHVVADEACIRNIGISPGFQGRGLARLLLRQASSLAIRHGASMLHLEVRDSNEAARTLYLSEGFGEDGRRRDYYCAPVEDAILMSRRLSSAVRG